MSTTATTATPSKNTTTTTSAIHGHYGSSHAQKLTFSAIHAAAVGCSAWMLLSSSTHPINSDVLPSFFVHQDSDKSSLARRVALVAASATYLGRVLFGSYGMLPRKMGWGEVGFVGSFMVFVHLLFAKAGGAHVAGEANGDVSAAAAAAATSSVLGDLTLTLGGALYVLGSILNTGSEYLRYRWKQKKSSKGRLYTGGFFSLSMHVNYFGDTVLFCGFALMTTKWWAFFTPAIMTMGFVAEHIPDLDRYLANRYPDDFAEYSRKTAKLIPFVW